MKKMKKLLAGFMAATMIMSMNMVAFAETSDGVAASDPITFKFEKTYKTADGKTPATFPLETLKFEVTVPEGITNPDSTMISIEDHTMSVNPEDITVTVPEYSKVGLYEYTITETTGNTQGVTYANTTFNVKVVATYNDKHDKIVTEVVFITPDGDEGKIDSFENIYDLAALDVSKVVTGNLGSTTKEFEVDVTFTKESNKEVKSNITYVDGDETLTIPASAFDESDSKTVTITVKHGETVSFTNIPYGITWKVEEHDYTKGDANSDDGYEAPVYSDNDAAEADAQGTANTVDADTVEITNKKGVEVNTGISLDNMPYIMVLAMVALGLVGFVSKKRSMEF